ncbi:DUF7946 domain-containing protein [Sphingopyxis sp. MSC1_008]|jgi:hypothetical protein|uniref:DUF7946 domain-containing protein n=1 Tax=Sphingopyxis sp. MSC1_008 TaxID=2909265 RepID=UPI0020C052ED|nr:hypothetical protein [Sphingopyxis sp. MSC1_008]
MDDADFRIVYKGGEADQHQMDMRMLALSMLGAERIISDGLIVLVYGRLPKRGERAPVIAKAKEPAAGSLELISFFNAIFGTLPLGLPLAKELASHFLEEWWKAVIARFSGKPDVAEAAIKAMAEMNRDHLAARDANDQRRHEEFMAMIDVFRAAVAGQQRAAEQFATPIGPSVHNATVFPSLDRPVTIDTSDAEAIRDAAKLEWTSLREMTLRTDGFRFHTNGLSIENPDQNGFLMARVRDPSFDEPSNPYTEAAQRRAEIVVLGRQGYKGSTLAGIEIVDFVRENPL